MSAKSQPGEPGQSVVERARAEIFTNEEELSWLLADGRTMQDALALWWPTTDPLVAGIEVTRVPGRIEDRGEREGGLWFIPDDEHGDVECWQIEVTES